MPEITELSRLAAFTEEQRLVAATIRGFAQWTGPRGISCFVVERGTPGLPGGKGGGRDKRASGTAALLFEATYRLRPGLRPALEHGDVAGPLG